MAKRVDSSGTCSRCQRGPRKRVHIDGHGEVCDSCENTIRRNLKNNTPVPPFTGATWAKPKLGPKATTAPKPPKANPIRHESPISSPWPASDARAVPAAPAATPQPAPTRGQRDVTVDVIGDLVARSNFGVAKYGGRLMTGNGRDALVDCYQEALDLVSYLKQAILERDAVASGAVVQG
jgi:hypothetical protein